MCDTAALCSELVAEQRKNIINPLSLPTAGPRGPSSSPRLGATQETGAFGLREGSGAVVVVVVVAVVVLPSIIYAAPRKLCHLHSREWSMNDSTIVCCNPLSSSSSSSSSSSHACLLLHHLPLPTSLLQQRAHCRNRIAPSDSESSRQKALN